MKIIKANTSRDEFLKWFYSRGEIRCVLIACVAFSAIGVFFYYIGQVIYNRQLYDVLFLFLTIGFAAFFFGLITPFFAYSRNIDREIHFENNVIEILEGGLKVTEYHFRDIKLIYVLPDLILFEIKGYNSIPVYKPNQEDLNEISMYLANTKIRIFFADSILNIMLRNYRSSIL